MFSLLHWIRSQPVRPDSAFSKGQCSQGRGREGKGRPDTPAAEGTGGTKGCSAAALPDNPGDFPVVCLNTSAAGAEGSHAPLTVCFALFSFFSSLQKAPGPCWNCSCNRLQKLCSGAGWKRLSWRVGGRHRERGEKRWELGRALLHVWPVLLPWTST